MENNNVNISYFKIFVIGAVAALGLRFGDNLYTKFIEPRIILFLS